MMDRQNSTPVATAFEKLLSFAIGFDPIKLLTQLWLTHLRAPEDQFVGADNELAKWSVRIEFLAGLLLTRRFPSKCNPHVDGQTMQQIEDLFGEYDRAVDLGLISSRTNQISNSQHSILKSIRHFARWVRGDAHEHQYYIIARGVYGPHKDWFKSSLGFTIEDVITAFKALTQEYNNRLNNERIAAKQYAAKFVNQLGVRKEESEELEVSVFCKRYFGRSDEIFGFTVEDLVELSGLSEYTCIQILDRMSQTFGYRNPAFPHTFEDPEGSPWDYNTLYERPLIEYDGRYWMILPSVIHPTIMTTFFFDLMADKSYRPKFEEARGSWLESKTAEFLRRVFPSKEVLLNPLYPNGDELADVLVLHDRKLLIFQCKSKGLTFRSRMGHSFKELKSDLEKAVENAYSQGVRARSYLLRHTEPTLRFKDTSYKLEIDQSQINGVFIINVTLAPLQNIITRWASLNSELGLFEEGDYPWSVSLTDLDVITEISPGPPHFLHYVKRRIEVEHLSVEVLGDESDLFGCYLDQGLYFSAPGFEKVDPVMLTGSSHKIDEYMYDRHVLKKPVSQPSAPMPGGFSELITAISQTKFAYKIDVAMSLLDLRYDDRCEFMKRFQRIQQLTNNEKNLNSFSMKSSRISRGIVCLTMECNGDAKVLYRYLYALVSWNIDQSIKTLVDENGCVEWIGMGWDASTDSVVDAVIYVVAKCRDSDSTEPR